MFYSKLTKPGSYGKKILVFPDLIIRLTMMRADANLNNRKAMTASKLLNFA